MNSNLGIKDLAKLADVSIGTVDRVLHNREGVSLKTKEKVLKIVQETGYKKNVMASRLKLASIKVLKIAVLVPETIDDWSYWNLPVIGISKAVEELSELGISTVKYSFDLRAPKSFSDAIEEIIDEKYDALITVPFFEKESNLLLEKAKGHNIPVVFLDTERELNLPTNFITQNSGNAGKVAGRLLHGLVGEQGVYFVVNILNERGIQINNLQRETGFRSYFKENFEDGDKNVHTLNNPMKGKLTLSPELIELLESDTPIGIFVTNARSFLLPNIISERSFKNIRIVGFDLNKKNVEYLKSGNIDFLINQKPQYQGYSAVKGLYKYLTEGDEALLNIDIPVEIVVKENVDFSRGQVLGKE